MSVSIETALPLMKARLNRLPGDTSLDGYFTARLHAAAQEIEGTGIALEGSVEDTLNVVDLAVWNYQNRDKAAGMPQWLRERLKNRWIREGVSDARAD